MLERAPSPGRELHMTCTVALEYYIKCKRVVMFKPVIDGCTDKYATMSFGDKLAAAVPVRLTAYRAGFACKLQV